MAMGPKNGSQLTHKTILSSIIHSMQFCNSDPCTCKPKEIVPPRSVRRAASSPEMATLLNTSLHGIMVYHGISWFFPAWFFPLNIFKRCQLKRQSNEPMEPFSGCLLIKKHPDELGAHVTVHVMVITRLTRLTADFDWLSLVDSGQPVASSSPNYGIQPTSFP